VGDLRHDLVWVGAHDPPLAICSIGNASAALSISIGSVMSCFCAFASNSGDQTRVFSSAAFSVSSYDT
jgi:hypothetical protein